jgi:glyoxylase-like metal-dependent hydrolase (beta-lactamase superfamily II)
MRAWLFSAGSIESSQRLMHGRGPWFSGHRVSLTCVLVERAGGLVLVDTGWGSITTRAPRAYPGTLFRLTAGRADAPYEDTALGRVRALGFSADDVRDVVVTHLDIDHVGGLCDFPRARVHVSRVEHVARFTRPPFRSRLHDSSPAFAHGPRFAIAELVDDPVLGFERSSDLFGDGSVVLLGAGGHTRGHCAVLVRANGRTLVHAGDAFVDARELAGESELPLGVRLYRRVLHEDKPAARATLDRLREIQHEVALVNAHDASLLARLPAFPSPI